MTPSFNRRDTLAMLGASLALAGPLGAQEKTVRLVLPNATGSGVDAIARTMQPALAKALGMNVVVENQPGAGGVVGLQTLSRAAPDGLTLSIVSNNVVIFPNVIKALPFDMGSDFTIIASCGYTPVVLVVNPKVPANNAKEFVAWLKSKNGEANYASGGSGTILHLAAEMFLDESGTKAKHVPYRGVGPMLTDILSGQVDFGTAALPSVQQHIKSGAMRAIGVGTDKRVAAAPEIPTFVEQGLPGYVVEAWFAMLGPKGMAQADVRRINAALAAAVNDPAVKETLAKQGNVINISTPEAGQKFFKDELVKYAALSKKAGLEAQ